MRSNKRKKKRLIAVLIFILILLLAAALFLFFSRRGGNERFVLEISESIEPPAVTYYLQRDELWKNDKLGESSFTMGSSGCLVTSIASLLNLYGEQVTPGQLNKKLQEAGAYNSTGDVIWAGISEAYPEIRTIVPGNVEPDEIEKALKNGRYPLVKVKHLGNGYWHWVLLIGSDERGYLCMDPLYNKKEARPLSDHGGKVYSYRLVVKEGPFESEQGKE